MRKKRVTVIGGGTGTYNVLLGLKRYPLDISVIVTMMDSGGSNRVIRDEFGFLPTSDLRQVMVALASENTDKLLRELFTYRYNAGTGISGMTFGNLFMAALTDILHSQEKAIKETCELLHVKGDILPVTYENTHLVARYANGKQVLGEHNIDEPCEEVSGHRIVGVEVFPPAKANAKAISAIKSADLILLGPGDLFTSVLSNIVITGISSAIKKAKGKKVFVMNLMTRHGQTDNFSAKDHISEIEKYLGEKILDTVIVNKGRSFPAGVLARYREENAFPVRDNLNAEGDLKIIRGDFVSKVVFEKARGDKLTRSLIRHDSKKLAKAIVSLL